MSSKGIPQWELGRLVRRLCSLLAERPARDALYDQVVFVTKA